MQLALILAIQIVLLFSQNVECDDSLEVILNENEISSYERFNNGRNFFRRFWEDVKKHWNSLKKYGEKTQDKIKEWVKVVKDHAQTTKEFVKDKIQDMKAILEKTFETGKHVQICLKSQHDELEEIMRQIFDNIIVCLSDNVNKLEQIARDDFQGGLHLDESKFINKIENNLQKCLASGATQEDCILIAREGIYDDVDDIEEGILDKTIETRNLKNDILDSIVSCSVNGLINAASAITNQTIQIIHCVRELEQADFKKLICV